MEEVQAMGTSGDDVRERYSVNGSAIKYVEDESTKRMLMLLLLLFFFFKQKTAYEMLRSLVGSEMCIRVRRYLAGRRLADY